LACPDVTGWGDCMLELVPRFLQGESREMHRLVLRVLLVLCKTPSMALKVKHHLLRRLVQLLQDADAEVVGMTLSVFSKVLRAKRCLLASPTILQLALTLRLLFDHEGNHVQLLSICLFQEVMALVVEDGRKPLKRHVVGSLLPLFFHLHNE
ncbi:hypothetical protein N330_01691, partial [Leptosomus discolor]